MCKIWSLCTNAQRKIKKILAKLFNMSYNQFSRKGNLRFYNVWNRQSMTDYYIGSK